MLPLVWAFGSMFVLMLIIFMLPLGLTVKGKLLSIFSSFVFALGGLVTVKSFPLWETTLMLSVLIFFTAYFMDKRIGTLIFKEIPSYEEAVTTEYNIPFPGFELDKVKNNNSLELTDVEKVEQSAIKMIDNSQLLAQPLAGRVNGNENKLLEEDISFLLERDSVNEFGIQKEEVDSEIDYLSNIESLLEEETLDLALINDEEELDDSIIPNDIELLEDPAFDFLYAQKEVAVGKDDIQK